MLESHAIDLGIAFQLTNFIRDVAEDLRRGRIYLPQETLAQFGVDEERLRRGIVDESIRGMLAWEIERARGFYASAAPGIDLVDPTSRDCLRCALTLYSGILDEIERADYDVFSRRAHVGTPRRVAVGVTGLRGAVSSRRRARRAGHPVDAVPPVDPPTVAPAPSARLRAVVRPGSPVVRRPRASPGRRERTASSVRTAQTGITRKNSSSSSGNRPGSVTPTR